MHPARISHRDGCSRVSCEKMAAYLTTQYVIITIMYFWFFLRKDRMSSGRVGKR